MANNLSSSISPGLLFDNLRRAFTKVRFEYIYLLLRQSLQSKYIFEAKDGRFRISNADIGYKQVKTSGTLRWGASVESSSGHQPIAKVWGAG